MRKTSILTLTTALLLMLALGIVAAQQSDDSTCAAVIETAIDDAESACDGLAAGEACFAGETRTLDAIGELRTGGLDGATWDIAQLRVPADLESGAATLILFGPAQVQNLNGSAAVELTPTPSPTPLPTLMAVPRGNLRVRSGPGTNFDIITVITPEDEVEVIGRTEAGDWVLIALDLGFYWTFTEILTLDGPVERLPVVDPTTVVQPEAEAEPVAYDLPDEAIVRAPDLSAPMQAFSLSTQVDGSDCADAPAGGLLIQTPTDAETTFLVNGIAVTVRGTALLRAESGQSLDAVNLGGSLRLTRDGRGTVIAPGQQITLSPDASTSSAYAAVERLPLDLLPDRVDSDVAGSALPVGTYYDPASCTFTDAAGQPNRSVQAAQAGEPLVMTFYSVDVSNRTQREKRRFLEGFGFTFNYAGETVDRFSEIWGEFNTEIGEGYGRRIVWMVDDPQPGTVDLQIVQDFPGSDETTTFDCTLTVAADVEPAEFVPEPGLWAGLRWTGCGVDDTVLPPETTYRVRTGNEASAFTLDFFADQTLNTFRQDAPAQFSNRDRILQITADSPTRMQAAFVGDAADSPGDCARVLILERQSR